MVANFIFFYVLLHKPFKPRFFQALFLNHKHNNRTRMADKNAHKRIGGHL